MDLDVYICYTKHTHTHTQYSQLSLFFFLQITTFRFSSYCFFVFHFSSTFSWFNFTNSIWWFLIINYCLCILTYICLVKYTHLLLHIVIEIKSQHIQCHRIGIFGAVCLLAILWFDIEPIHAPYGMTKVDHCLLRWWACSRLWLCCKLPTKRYL